MNATATPDGAPPVEAFLESMYGLVRDEILGLTDLEEILRSTVPEGLVASMELEDLAHYLIDEKGRDPVQLHKKIAQEVFLRKRG